MHQLIDYKQANWGHVGMRSATLNDVEAVPEPSVTSIRPCVVHPRRRRPSASPQTLDLQFGARNALMSSEQFAPVWFERSGRGFFVSNSKHKGQTTGEIPSPLWGLSQKWRRDNHSSRNQTPCIRIKPSPSSHTLHAVSPS